MSISIANKTDIPGIVTLVNSAYRGDEAKKGWTHEADLIEGSLRTDEAALTESIVNPNAVILKYTDAGKITGCVYLEKQGRKLYLGMLSVSPGLQSRGIGKKLLKAADDHAKYLGCTIIEMTVISARPELIAWYQRHGYQTTNETRPFHDEEKFGIPRQPIEFVVMQKQV